MAGEELKGQPEVIAGENAPQTAGEPAIGNDRQVAFHAMGELLTANAQNGASEELQFATQLALLELLIASSSGIEG